jgi:hypothetical protein
VRQRADVNMPTVEEVEGTSLSKDELLEVIKHERRVELAFKKLSILFQKLSEQPGFTTDYANSHSFLI